jgi:TolB-like protein/DNA-binding winged helix-turn-helix (wHTH) protein
MKYEVDDITIDVGQRQVLRGDEQLDVGGLTFDLLVAIVESAPNLISHDELVEKVWSGRETSPETITQRAAMLRQALGDHADSPKYVEVMRGHGFRLIPEVNGGRYESANPNNRVGLVVVAIVVIAVVAAYLLPHGPEISETSTLPNSVAVLPFENISPDPDDAYFAVGLHRETINRLASISDIRVISQRSVSRYVDGDVSIRDIASELNVETVMEGSVRISEDEFRLTLQLVDGATETTIWSDEFPGNLAHVFTTQAEVASRIAFALKAQLTDDEADHLASVTNSMPEAVRRYLRAKSLDLSREQKIVHLDAAISIDPAFARALADRAYLRANDLPNLILEGATQERINDISQLITDDANKALRIDPNLGYAYVALGHLDVRRTARCS